jgi:hypothetical protein
MATSIEPIPVERQHDRRRRALDRQVSGSGGCNKNDSGKTEVSKLVHGRKSKMLNQYLATTGPP